MPSASKNGASGGSEPVLFVFIGQLARFDLAGFHVRLVERIDADNRTRDGGGNLPAEEFLAECRKYPVRKCARRDGRPFRARRRRRPASRPARDSNRR